MKEKIINAMIVLDLLFTAAVLCFLYEQATHDCPNTTGFVFCSEVK